MGPDYTLFLDESGDPTLQFAGRAAPDPPEIFLLCGCLVPAEEHPRLVRALNDLKYRHLGRSDLPLVSRQLRKHKGVFRFLDDPGRRASFYTETGDLIQRTRFTVFAAGIDKYRYWRRYGAGARSPYDLSLGFLMERVALSVSAEAGRVEVVAESRGRREDNALRAEFARLRQFGTRYISAGRLRNCFPDFIEFREKKQNIAGLQLADLIAYPLANRLCHPASRRTDFEIVYAKLHRSSKGVWGAGLKVFSGAKAADYGL